MIEILQGLAFVLVMAAATAVVFTRQVRHQVIVFSGFGVTLALLFTVLHAPDVALSEIAVGSVAMPFLVITVLARLARGGE